MLNAIERTLQAFGWSPKLARIGMWALLCLAIGSIFDIKIKI